MEENINRENIIMRIWKDHTTEDSIIVIEKVIKPETINFCWIKPRPDVVHDFTGFTTAHLGNHERDCGYGNKGKRWRVLSYGSQRNSKAKRWHMGGIDRK